MIVGRTVNYRRVKNPIALHRARVADPLFALFASLFDQAMNREWPAD